MQETLLRERAIQGDTPQATLSNVSLRKGNKTIRSSNFWALGSFFVFSPLPPQDSPGPTDNTELNSYVGFGETANHRGIRAAAQERF